MPAPETDTRPRVYVASKSHHGAKWLRFREGHPEVLVVSTWIEEWEQGASTDLVDLWNRCVTEVESADALIAFHRPDEVWKGAFIEIGAALVKGIPVLLVGDPPGTWVNHPLVTRMPSVSDAATHALVLTRHRRLHRLDPSGDGWCDVCDEGGGSPLHELCPRCRHTMPLTGPCDHCEEP